MEPSFLSNQYETSGYSDDTICYESYGYNGPYYQYECGKSFIQICVEMGLDSNGDDIIIKF